MEKGKEHFICKLKTSIEILAWESSSCDCFIIMRSIVKKFVLLFNILVNEALLMALEQSCIIIHICRLQMKGESPLRRLLLKHR